MITIHDFHRRLSSIDFFHQHSTTLTHHPLHCCRPHHHHRCHAPPCSPSQLPNSSPTPQSAATSIATLVTTKSARRTNLILLQNRHYPPPLNSINLILFPLLLSPYQLRPQFSTCHVPPVAAELKRTPDARKYNR